TCFTAYQATQLAMRHSQLQSAREAANTCVKECPNELRADCAKWLEQIETRQPSVVVECRRRDGSTVNDSLIVLLDGTPWREHLDGRAGDGDPGEPVFGVDGGGGQFEQKVVVREGEKAQRVTLTANAEPQPVFPPPALSPSAPPEPANPRSHAP